GTHMKLFALLVLAYMAPVSAFADTNVSTCTELLANAGAVVKQVNDRFNVGEVTRTDVAKAELDQLQVRFECRDILAKDYCDSATKLAALIVAGVKEEAAHGQADTMDLLAAQKQAIQINGLCR
ncbi:MAG: hypothetical protein ACXVBE_05690, partial [Bdellovibrionota bacterium]